MIAVSTSWNALRLPEGASVVEEIKSLGISALEINYQATRHQLLGIEKSLQSGHIKVLSLHNIVPLPPGSDPQIAHRLYPFTSPDADERNQGIELAKRTIDWAEKLGAGGVVLHLGENWDAGIIEMERNYVNAKLKSRAPKEKLEEMRARLVEVRRDFSEPALERIRKALSEIVPYAQDRRIKLGIENRYWFYQFPNLDELQTILAEFKQENLGLWFDVGHAATQEYLGFQRKNEVMDRFGHRIIGTHLMDCIRNSDHLAPGQGQVDFANLARYLKPDTIKVLEMALFVKADDIQKGVEILAKAGIS